MEAVKVSLEAGVNMLRAKHRVCVRERSRGRTRLVPGGEVTANDIIRHAPAAHVAQDIAISTIANVGQNILVPRPGFPCTLTFCGFRDRDTRVQPSARQWIEVADLHGVLYIDEKTAAIVVNSRPNPAAALCSPPAHSKFSRRQRRCIKFP